MDKPEFRVERGPAATDEAFAIGMAKLLEREGRTIAAAELRRLHPYETAYKEWHEKTEWVQTTARPGEFGMHRADVMRQRLEQAKAQRDALLEALKAAETYLRHADVDYNVYVQCRAAIKKVQEGD